MNWIPLTEASQLDQLQNTDRPFVIYKHSTRCHICTIVLKNIERDYQGENFLDFYFLDLLNHRDISNHISETYQVHHESPQILLIKNGECIFDESHQSIDLKEILELASKN